MPYKTEQQRVNEALIFIAHNLPQGHRWAYYLAKEYEKKKKEAKSKISNAMSLGSTYRAHMVGQRDAVRSLILIYALLGKYDPSQTPPIQHIDLDDLNLEKARIKSKWKKDLLREMKDIIRNIKFETIEGPIQLMVDQFWDPTLQGAQVKKPLLHKFQFAGVYKVRIAVYAFQRLCYLLNETIHRLDKLHLESDAEILSDTQVSHRSSIWTRDAFIYYFGDFPSIPTVNDAAIKGKFLKTYVRRVRNNYMDIYNAVANQPVELHYGGKTCSFGTVAYVTTARTKSTRIHICEAFFKDKFGIGSARDEGGSYSPVGTLIHELSHLIIGTEDYAYGRKECHRLAHQKEYAPAEMQTGPVGYIKSQINKAREATVGTAVQKAMENADTYQFFSETFQRKVKAHDELDTQKRHLPLNIPRLD